jgi:histidine triad (HIT) family protein
MDPCVFCGIASGALPSWRLYEDDAFLAFLDVNPVCRGHVLVAPRAHHVNLFDLDPALTGRYLTVVQAVAQRVCARLGATDFNVFNANGRDAQQSVFHVHFHIVPRWKGDGMDFEFPHRARPSAAEFEELRQLLAAG